jgi:SSS family solute:Na+ symporter
VGGGVGFVLAILTAVIVSRFTTPKPDKELVGLVRGLTDTDAALDGPKATGLRSPVVLGVAVLVLVVLCYLLLIIF